MLKSLYLSEFIIFWIISGFLVVVVVKTLEFCGLRILIGGFVTELKLFCRVFAKWAKGAGW